MTLCLRGLSPRVRGNPMSARAGADGRRSIPACAGEPFRGNCGGGLAQGLSPRVRGNLFRCPPLPHRPGSIPACAGEPGATATKGNLSRVYPRVCGGTRKCRKETRPASGLSPRVRGNQYLTKGTAPGERSIPACAGEPTWKKERGGVRSIPACAGEPRGPDLRAKSGPVYPRVCGGTVFSPSTIRIGKGLSPRVRGNPTGSLGRD